MNVFVPYSSPLDCAKALWSDRLRFNKQIIECRQIIASINGAKAWRNHPVCLMYKDHKEWLEFYLQCFETYRDSKKSVTVVERMRFEYLSELYSKAADSIRPPFLNDEFCDQHKRRLYCKAEHLYPQFAEYGKSDINWYFVNSELLKYKNGKRIKE